MTFKNTLNSNSRLAIACCLVVAILVASSCTKKSGKEVATETTSLTNQSFVQVFDATVGSSRNYVYVDGVPMTGAALAYGSSFPLTPANFSVTAGFKEFSIRDTLRTTTQPQLNFSESLQPNTYYSIFTYDTMNAVKQKTVTNNIIIPSDTTARLRFAYFAYSPNAIPNIDLFSSRRAVNVFSNVGFGDVTDFIPYDSRVADTLFVRIAGTSTNLLNRTATGTTPIFLVVAPTRKRSYTVIFRGGYRTDLTTAATVRTLSLLANN